MKPAIYHLLLALILSLPQMMPAQIPIPEYLSQLPKEEADVLRKEYNATRALAIQKAGIRSQKEYKTKPGEEKRMVREYFFDEQGRFSRVEVYSPKGILGEVEEVQYHPGTNDQQLYTRSHIGSDGKKEIKELERYALDGTTTEKIELGYRFKPEHTTYRFGKDGQVLEMVARSFENGQDGDTVRITHLLPSALAPQILVLVYTPATETYQQGIRVINDDGDDSEMVVATRAWSGDDGLPPLIYDADGKRVISQDDVHLYLQGQTVDIDPPFEVTAHYRLTWHSKGKMTRTEIRDPDGSFGTTMASTYDEQGRILTTTRYNFDATGDTKTYKYDAADRLVHIEEENTNYTFEYHPNGTIKRYFKDNQGGQPNFKTVEEVYGEDGRILWNLDRLGYAGTVRETRNDYHYDLNGVLLKISTTSNGPVSEVTFEAGE